ncbi:exodeoxyribonuclease VII large subunit [Methanolobus halotolerans]|uniref:Exodeoxyribonuclease VII large subunit n=1 Tax=Methanolobus halotolerans TaxID=2052935 RepID=A0A4E0Q925_9EURY|nr:exodeoxyribonuclease VII large subunit [Methanolobus halotolerans]TGC08498.1 exodeoxyribonuclease VII large subunit [Methanolobus halotolerans]
MGIYTVSQLNDYVKHLLKSDPMLNQIWVRGEISNLTKHGSGHYYFTLKDKGSQISCVSFRSTNRSFKFDPESTMRVLIFGSLDVYTVRGQYQLRVLDMRPDGIGELYKAYEQLRTRLQDEGLFEVSHKRPVPRYPLKIGVATSPTGAAVHDILNVLKRRYPVDVLLSPTIVQGEISSASIVCSIEKLNRADVDVIILGRGGGSLEDLWSFNEESVARAIYGSSVPIISAVGHETDYTIADFTADLRAPTPSVAAELAVPDSADLERHILSLSSRMERAAMRNISDYSERLHHLCSRIGPEKLNDFLRQNLQRVDELSLRMERLSGRTIESKRSLLGNLSGRLNAVSPLKTLERGYGIAVRTDDREIIRSTGDVSEGDDLGVLVSDGMILCSVKGTSDEHV